MPGGKDMFVDTKYVQMLQDVLKVAHLYYSLHMDLTKRLQGIPFRKIERPDSMCEGLTEEDHRFPTTMNPLFMFNHPTIQELAPFKEYFPRDLIPIVIFGFMKIIPSLTAGAVSFTLTLISRRSIHRVGRRFNTRGADADGYVANFVETEQIVKTASRQVYSHVQVRGSIPLAWTQTPTMKYTPRIHIDDVRIIMMCSIGHEASAESFRQTPRTLRSRPRSESDRSQEGSAIDRSRIRACVSEIVGTFRGWNVAIHRRRACGSSGSTSIRSARTCATTN